MHIEHELNELNKKISSDELLDRILRSYIEEMREEGIYDIEKEYQESKRVLEAAFTEEQKQRVKSMEDLFTENMKYSIGFGFQQGIYAGFEQYFIEQSTKDPFDRYVHQKLLQMPGMQKHLKFYERKTEINKLFEELQICLNGEDSERLTTIYSSFEEKLLGALRYSFYIGYRYALNIIEEVDFLGVEKITDKILFTEYTLGFAMTGKEKERRKEKAALL